MPQSTPQSSNSPPCHSHQTALHELLDQSSIHPSNSPPCHSTLSKFNFHFTYGYVNALATSGLSSTFCMIGVADLNVFALSETIKLGIPRLVVKRLKYWINVTALNPMTNSRWTARVEQQVYEHNHVFSPLVVSWSLMYIRLVKSTSPVQLKVRDCFTLKSGNGGGGMDEYGLPYRQ